MAFAFPEEKSTHDNLMTCVFCIGKPISLKLLPCQHSCCVDCLIKKVTAPDFTFPCPSCERKVYVKGGHVKQLPDNFLYKTIQEQRAGSIENFIICALESKPTKASHKCLDCQDAFCADCEEFHKYSSLTIKHKVVEIKDIKLGKYSKEIKDKKVNICAKHSSEGRQHLNFMCKTCKILVCQHCVLLEHKSHNYETLDASDSHARSTLKREVNQLEKKQKREANLSTQVDKEDRELDLKKEAIENKVHQEATKLHDLVDKIKDGKLEKVKNHYETEKKKIKEFKSRNQSLRSQTDAMKSFAESFLQHSSKVDFVFHVPYVQSGVKDIISRKDDFTITTKHLTIENTPCIAGNDVIEKIIGKLAIAERTTDENGKTKETSKDTYRGTHQGIYMDTRQPNIPLEQLNEIAVEEVHRHNRGISLPRKLCKPQKLFDVKSGMSKVSGLSTTTDNDIIAVGGSQIGVFSNDGIHKRWIRCQELRNACDVAVSKQLIYIIYQKNAYDSTGNRILIIDLNGSTQRSITIPNPSYGFRFSKTALAVDRDDNIFIACCASSTIYKCTSQSSSLQPFLTKTSNRGLNSPISLCLTLKQELIVLNKGSRHIRAYNMNAHVLWTYEYHNYPKVHCNVEYEGQYSVPSNDHSNVEYKGQCSIPYNVQYDDDDDDGDYRTLCCDEDGNIYVCGNTTIRVVKDQKYIGSIDLKDVNDGRAVSVNGKQEILVSGGTKIMKMRVWQGLESKGIEEELVLDSLESGQNTMPQNMSIYFPYN